MTCQVTCHMTKSDRFRGTVTVMVTCRMTSSVSAPPSRGDVQIALVEIEDRIESIEEQLAACAPLVAERDRLISARATILGVEPDGESLPRATRVTRGDVAAYLAAAPGSRAGEIARALGTTQQIVSAHLYRGKREEFDNRGGRWFLRDN